MENKHRHNWIRDRHGYIDIMAADWPDFHNGPVCASCRDSFCVHCANIYNRDYLKRFNEMSCDVENGLDDKPYTKEDF